MLASPIEPRGHAVKPARFLAGQATLVLRVSEQHGNRFSPVRVKFTTRLPGVGSRAAQFSSVKRFMTAAPSVPAR